MPYNSRVQYLSTEERKAAYDSSYGYRHKPGQEGVYGCSGYINGGTVTSTITGAAAKAEPKCDSPPHPWFDGPQICV